MRWATNDTEGSSRVVRNCFLCVRTWYFAEFYLRATFSCARRQIVSYDNSRRMERSEHNSDSNCASRWNKKMRRKEISRKTKFQLHINIDFAKWKTWRPKRFLNFFSPLCIPLSKLFARNFRMHHALRQHVVGGENQCTSLCSGPVTSVTQKTDGILHPFVVKVLTFFACFFFIKRGFLEAENAYENILRPSTIAL